MKLKTIIKNTLFIVTALLSCSQIQAKEKKTLFIIVDGIPADAIERLHVPVVYDIAKKGSFGYSYVGGTVGEYTETPTISAVGYNTMLTGTWVNKHNVYGNSNLKPDYNYWTFFKIAKEQDKKVSTAIFSSWTDNRTVLLGDGKAETGNMKIDYVYDGYDLDTINYPHKDKHLHVFDYDETVAKNATKCIRQDAPDLNWVYLWYTDDASHMSGNGKYFDKYILKAGKQVEKIWEAVKYREKNFDEEWLVILTTDHGRTNNGYSHGGQSFRERRTWVAMNKVGNKRLLDGRSAAVDINPTICRFMGFKVPDDVRFEQDGVSIIGTVEMEDLKIMPYDNNVTLSWKCNKPSQARLYASITNNYKEYGKDEWIDLGPVNLSDESKIIDLQSLPKSNFYKFVLCTPSTSLNC